MEKRMTDEDNVGSILSRRAVLGGGPATVLLSKLPELAADSEISVLWSRWLTARAAPGPSDG